MREPKKERSQPKYPVMQEKIKGEKEDEKMKGEGA